jgi:DNA-binding winged helix-turn-helix (wHTH) protein/tetratricopeptide (TPR) repeat protein
MWIGEWLVEPGLNRVSRGDEHRRLEPKVLDLLLYLASQPGRTVSKDELLDRVWSGRAVVDAVLTRAVSEIRAALGETPREARYIQTVARKGYRLAAPVRAEPRPAGGKPAETPPDPGENRHAAVRRRPVLAAGALLGVVLAGAAAVLTSRPPDRLAAPGDLPSTSVTALLSPAGEVEPEALRLYLLGRYHWSRRSAESLETARNLFERATAHEPGFAEAWSGLADSLIQLANYYRLDPAVALPWAREAAGRALEIDPGLAEAHASLGLIHLNLDWDAAAALDAYHAALELSPGYSSAHQWTAEALSILGRHDEALAAIEDAARLEPLAPVIHAAWGQRLNKAGRYREALVRFGDALELAPELIWAHRERAYAFERLGERDAALAERRREMVARRLPRARIERLDRVSARDGMAGFWAWQLAELERRSADDWVPAALLAEALAANGETESAFEALERARGESAELLLQIEHSPAFDEIRDHPAFPRTAGAPG